jgi:hypothetical protein
VLKERIRAVISRHPPALRKVLLVFTLVATLIMPVATVLAAPAGALPTSCPPGCRGEDPHTVGCDRNATTVTSSSYWSTSQGKYLTIELRYSPFCDMSWAKISPAPKDWEFDIYNHFGSSYLREKVGYDAPSWWGIWSMVWGARPVS